jgi:putative membrane protein
MTDTEIETDEILPPDRSRLIAERRLMDWVRTAFSMIAFGFGIYKVLQFIGEQTKVPLPRPDAPRNVGLALIAIGTFAIIVASVQHWKHLKRLRSDQPRKPWDLTLIVACLTALLGFLLFGSVLFRSGPFG